MINFYEVVEVVKDYLIYCDLLILKLCVKLC